MCLESAQGRGQRLFSDGLFVRYFTAPFNNIPTLKFNTQPTNAFFATVIHMFGGSFQLPKTAERVVNKSLGTVQTTKQCSAVVGSWEQPPDTWLTVAKNAFVGLALNFRVRMLLKGAVHALFPKLNAQQHGLYTTVQDDGAGKDPWFVRYSLYSDEKGKNYVSLSRSCLPISQSRIWVTTISKQRISLINARLRI